MIRRKKPSKGFDHVAFSPWRVCGQPGSVSPNLTEFEVSTVPEAEFSGLKNGKLLKAAVEKKIDILLTIDKNIDYQQNINKFAIAIVILDVHRSHIKYIKTLIPEFIKQINSYKPGNAYKIESEK